jgi:hypothetical protein
LREGEDELEYRNKESDNQSQKLQKKVEQQLQKVCDGVHECVG